MIKLINNWIFTLVEAVLLGAFTALVLIFGDYFHILFGVALIVYSLIFVLTKVIAYRGVIQMIAIIEFFVVTVLAMFVIVNQEIFPQGNIVNTTVGVAMWFRAMTEILHSYHGQGEGREAKREFNAWKIFAYILLLTAGSFITTTAIISTSVISSDNNIVRYLIAGISAASSVIMIVLTVSNFHDYRLSKPRKVKEVNSDQPKIEGEVKEESTKKKAKKKKQVEQVTAELVAVNDTKTDSSDDKE